MATYTTEITSDKLISDNPVHQRLLKAYIATKSHVKGNLLEIGCGEGRGVEVLAPLATSYMGLDKIGDLIEQLRTRYPEYTFSQTHIPPLAGIADNTFETIVSFQVIEHIKNDKLYLKEIHRVLKPGGRAFISTPNTYFSLSRNPWHIREYTPDQLYNLCKNIFSRVKAKGIGGNEKVWEYHEANRISVEKITRWDFLNLQYNLPSALLKIPYEMLNRINRNKLHRERGKSVSDISHTDFLLVDEPEEALDLFYILEK